MTNFFCVKSKLKHLGLILFLFMLSAGANAQTSVTGIVSDPSGPIPGVNVSLKGSKNGVATNFDGKYTITNVPSNAVLVFSFMGYKTQEVNVKGQSQINVKLEEEPNSLKEVVVIGYGTQRKEAVTGSVATIKGEIMREVPGANVTQALQGRIAGVTMSQTSSKPGAEMQIRIRGNRSLSADNNPLIVLDGVPFAGSIGDISPDNIKSIDILKDASATAIYGSRGANGVILISTNKGQNAKFTYNAFNGLKKNFAQFPMMDGPEFVAFRKAATAPDSTTPLYSNGIDESNNVNTNWQDLFFRTGVVTSHDVGVSNGTENGNYNFGVSYYKEEAVVPGQDYNRITLRGAVDQTIGSHFKFGFSTNNNYVVSNGNNMGLYGNLSSSPIANPYNADGTLKRTIKMPLDENWVYTRESVNSLGDKWIDQTRSYSSYNTIYSEVKIPGVEGLKYHLDLGGNFRTSNGGNYTGEGVFNINPTTVSTASISSSLSTNWTIQNLLTYDRTFGDGTFVTTYRGNWNKAGNTSATLNNANGLPVVPGGAILTFLNNENPSIVYTASTANIGAGVLAGRSDFVVAPRGISRIVYPGLWKLGPYRTDGGTGLGQPNAASTRPFNIAKLSELYLIAAEAAVMGATTQSGKSARELVNVLRARAGKWSWDNNGNVAKVVDNSAAMVAETPATIDINYILAERAREYYGEGYRWYDLVRTQKWNELAGSYQICGPAYGNHTPITVTRDIKPHHYLRPIPQGQIDAMVMTAEEKTAYQNPNY
jgi:TonB-dependent SusC/RagA subfamily outer membrane receptor